MVEWLPPGSPAHRAARGYDWTTAEDLAWTTANAVRELTVMVGNMLRPAGEQGAPFELLPHPMRMPEEPSPDEQAEDEMARAEMEALPGWGVDN